MILKRLTLTNFRQYRAADICFRPGLTAIVGPNGSGKTTIVEAITWAFYGEQRGLKESVCNIWAPDGANKTCVRLEFDFDGEPYAVERTLKSATLTKLVSPERIMAKSLSAVTKEVERLLGLNYEQFKNSFCTEQKDLEFLNFSTKGRQQEEIARMLGYDRLRIAEKIAREKAKEAESLRRGMDVDLAKEPERNAELQQATKVESEKVSDLKTARENFASLEKHLLELQPKAEAAKKALKLIQHLCSRKDVIERLQAAEQEAKNRLEDLRMQLKERDDLIPVANEYESNEVRINSLRAEFAKIQQRQTLKARYDDAAARLDLLKQELAGLPATPVEQASKEVEKARMVRDHANALTCSLRERWQKERATVERDLKQARGERERLRDRLKQLDEAVKDGLCPTCGQPLKTGRLPESEVIEQQLAQVCNSIEVLEIEEKQLREQPEDLKSAEEQLASANRSLEESQATLTQAAAVEAKKSTLSSEVRQLQSSLDTLHEQLSKLPVTFDADALSELETRQSKIKPQFVRFQQFASLDQHIAQAQQALDSNFQERVKEETERAQAIEELRSLGYEETDLKKAEDAVQEFAATVAQRDQAYNRVVCSEQALEFAKERKRDAAHRVAEIQEIKKRARELDRRRLLFLELGKAFVELRDDLNSKTRPLLEVYAGDALNKLSGGRYYRIGLTERYEPEVFDDGVKKPIISGGEEDIVALALRLALARMIQERSGQQMSLLILDEVFGSLDDERRESVLTQLDAMRGMFKQIIFISHIDRINEAADRCLRVAYDPAKRESYIAEDASLDEQPLPDLASRATVI